MFLIHSQCPAYVCAISILTGVASGQQFVDETSSRFPSFTTYSNQASLCDVDQDGDLDVIFADGQGYSSQGTALRPRLLINDGSGVFSDESVSRTDGVLGWFRGVECGDIDRDGDWDIVLANDFYKSPVLLVNDGNGFFTNESNRLPSARLSSARAQFGDVNNDGYLDLLFCHSGTSSRFGSNGIPRLYVNDGTGNFIDVTTTQTPNVIVQDQQDCIFGDIDGDHDLDIHISTRNGNNGGSRIWVNDGEGNFSRLEGMPVDGSCYSFDFGDFDGDGDMDLLGANAGSSNREMLLRNDAGGTVWTDISSGISPNPTADDNDTKWLDFDMDGDLDFVVAALFANQERFYRNNGNGTFTQMTNMATSVTDSSLDVMIGDVTGDGLFDMITAQGESGNFTNRIYVNTGPRDTISPKIVRTEEVAPEEGQVDFVIRCEVHDQYTSDRGFHPSSIQFSYSVNGKGFEPLDMLWSGNSLWRVEISVPACSDVLYRVEATDRAGNTGVGEELGFSTTGNCEVPEDLNGDGAVNGEDLGLFLLQWGGAGSADFDQNGNVDGADFGLLLKAWTI